MKSVHYLLLILGYISLSAFSCNDDDDASNSSPSPPFQCRIDEGTGFTNFNSQGPVFGSPNNLEFEVETDLVDDRWIQLHFNMASLNTPITIDGSTNYATYVDINGVSYSAVTGTITIRKYDGPQNILNGSFDNLKFFSLAGDSVMVEDGIFNIDM